ncbi:hypothetical protein GGP41_002124 [Bipolaris sorokiniana]|uniref:Heterokaryon incompatibility domain-containing protein n=3 Tax=Cochliobolus sativus TaxID=45130 RepID=A0A8H5ZMY7_COCSA|nr:hypothetical protein GGP41_002124 [Bipolaris sorokiniana]
MLPGQATSSHHSPGYDHSPQFQLSGYVQKTRVWCSENFGILHPWSSHDELAPRHVDVDRINFQLVREWLEICKTSHKHDLAGPRGKECVPGFKVIDCRTKRIIPVPHNVCQYVALSYVWGDAAPEDHKAGQYPKTIEDSITVCNMLGFECLWVDRYCINQKDEAEKGVQINMMDCIYSQAQLTIVATDPNPSKGLPGVGSRARNKQQSLPLGNIELIKTYHTDEAILRSTWATRGWTFQEGYLSRRKLIFTENEAVYLCDDMYCQESIRKDISTRPTGQRQGLAGAAMDGICPMSTNERKGQVKLDDLLNEYNSRDLSYQSDALNACQGILRGLSIPHNWGLPIIPTSWWEADRQSPTSHGMNLYWQSDEPGIRRVEFPSWSWVGWRGQKIFHNYDHYYTDASVIEAKSIAGKWLDLEQCFNPRDGSLHTTLSERIRITGLTVQLTPYIVNQSWIKNRMPGYRPSHKGPHAVFPYSANIDIVATVHLDEKDASTDILQDVIAVLINRHEKRRHRGIMLVLKPDGDHYKRVGILNFRNLGIHKDRRDFTESKSLIKGENGCFWMKDFRQNAIEVE